MMNSGLQTLFTGRQITTLETTHSTNLFMAEMQAQRPFPEGAAVVAGVQTSGRGQAGERWVSDPGKNLLMSVIFYPSFLSVQNLFMLSRVFSLGICDGVKEILKKEVKIKWPNDIYFQNKKLCGILIENSVRNTSLNYSILGIGLNVNQEFFPAEIPNPISMKTIAGIELDLKGCFNTICHALEFRYLQLKGGREDLINKDYINALYRFEEYHAYANSTETFNAKITGVAEDGKILLTRKNGINEKYDFKELKYILY